MAEETNTVAQQPTSPHPYDLVRPIPAPGAPGSSVDLVTYLFNVLPAASPVQQTIPSIAPAQAPVKQPPGGTQPAGAENSPAGFHEVALPTPIQGIPPGEQRG
jgi:hypothetical protein